jgi:hypothetical protein
VALSNLTREPSAVKKGPDCTVCLALAELPKASATALRAGLSNPHWRFSQIAEEVASDKDAPEWVRNIQPGVYRRHARGECAAREKMR